MATSTVSYVTLRLRINCMNRTTAGELCLLPLWQMQAFPQAKNTCTQSCPCWETRDSNVWLGLIIRPTADTQNHTDISTISSPKELKHWLYLLILLWFQTCHNCQGQKQTNKHKSSIKVVMKQNSRVHTYIQIEQRLCIFRVLSNSEERAQISEFVPKPEYSHPSHAGIGIVRSEELGWRRDAGQLSWNRGKTAVYIPPIVLKELIFRTCSSWNIMLR